MRPGNRALLQFNTKDKGAFMGVSTPSQGFTEKEALRVLEFITKSGEINKPQKPLKILAGEVMLNCFGWSIASGTARLKKILQALEAENKIECARSFSNRITSIRPKNLISNETPDSSGLKEAEKEIVKKSLPESKSPENGMPKISADDHTKIHMQIMDCLGGRLSRKEKEKRGELYEDWLQISILGLINVLEELFPDIVFYGSCSRSDKLSMRDSHGDDLRFFLLTRRNGHKVSGYIIYDSKGAESEAEIFNEEVVLFPGQENALLKKAIWTNIGHRPVKSLIEEILDDTISVGLLPASLDKEKILERFVD